MAQSKVVSIETRRRAPAKPIAEMNAEEVMEAYDFWCAGDSSREMRDRGTSLGRIVVLFEHGARVSEGRGRGLVNALAAALERVAEPDRAEDEWNAQNNGGMP